MPAWKQMHDLQCNLQRTSDYKQRNQELLRLTEGTFKQRFSQQKATFKHRKYTNSTELSKYIWKLRDNNQDFNINNIQL